MSTGDTSAFDEMRRRLDAAGITYADTLDFGDEPLLRVELPSGRQTRSVVVSIDRLSEFEAIGLESIRYLQGHEAIVNYDDGIIEARILSPRGSIERMLGLVPGVERIGDEFPDEDEEERPRRSRPSLRVTNHDGVDLEVSPMSPTLATLTIWRGYSIKISAPPGMSHDDALVRLEDMAYALFFDLDLRYGVALELAPQRQIRRRLQAGRIPEPPVFPTSRYQAEPLALYRYGRAAHGLPLLEFLAYYQAIEFFFPYFSSAAAIDLIRTELLDPRFRAADDTAVSRLISLARPGGRAVLSERDQLRTTIAACVDVPWIVTALTVNEKTRDHFCANKQIVSGVKKLHLAGGDLDLRHQLADRIYDIRCRIVHAKQDGGDSGVELLLPSGPEAAALGPDIDLTRAIAQRVILSRALPLAT